MAACKEQIKALLACHDAVGYWGRILAKCNDDKKMLDQCFTKHKKESRKEHLTQARAERARWYDANSQLDEEKERRKRHA